MRVAIIVPTKDPLAPGQWSGTPHGLSGGFASLGAEVVPVGHLLPPVLHEADAALARLVSQGGATANRAWTRVQVRRLLLQRQLRAAGTLDLVVAMITEAYRLAALRCSCPVVTYDDATYAQMWRHPHSEVTNAGYPPRTVERWIRTQRESLRAADAACVSTGWAKRSVVADYGVADDRVHVVGMGHRPRGRALADRDWSHPCYLFVGVDWRRKNGARVLRAFARVHAADPAARLHLVGRHERVEMPGVVDHGFLDKADPAAQTLLDDLFAHATAFVLPSLLDPSPIAYLEAASAGVPVVATSQGGAGELLGEAAITVDPEDDDAIWRAMERLADPATARRLGAAAARAARDSSWSAVAGRILTAAAVPAAQIVEAAR